MATRLNKVLCVWKKFRKKVDHLGRFSQILQGVNQYFLTIFAHTQFNKAHFGPHTYPTEIYTTLKRAPARYLVSVNEIFRIEQQ